MSAINLVKSSLSSHLIRDLIGERTIDIYKEITTDTGEDSTGGALGWLIGAGARLTGFLLSGLARVGTWIIGAGVRWLVQGTIQIFSFNWNASDTEISQWMDGNNTSIAAGLGQLVGGGGVWLVSIGLAAAASLRFPVLGGKVALALAEEGGEEVRSYLRNFVTQAATALAQNAVIWTYLQSRRAFRKASGMPSSVAAGAKPWTIGDQVENWAQSLGGQWLRTFVDSALEEAGDAATEAGFILSYALDDYYQSVKVAQKSQLGEVRTVKIQPDKRIDDEFITLTGEQVLLQQQVQAALVTHRLVHNRDVGQIVGQPAEDWLRGGMQRRKLTVVFKSKAAPPWILPGERVREATFTVPEPDLSLTWQKIKLASKPFEWGKFRALAKLDNGRQMAVYGATAQDAEDKLRELLELSTAKMLTLSVSEEKDRHPNLKKPAVRMYPAYATLLIRRSTAEISGTNDLSGNNYTEETIRIDLWVDEEPADLPPLR